MSGLTPKQALTPPQGGNMIEISRAVRQGTIVAKRGNKYVRCSRRARPVGVYEEGGERITLTNNGTVRTVFPGGIVVRGAISIERAHSASPPSD